MASYIKFPDRDLPPSSAKPKQRISRQRRKRLDRDAEYNAMRDIYLEQNPTCSYCWSRPSQQVHHIVRGVAGRARSLLNPDTWLGVCSVECHEAIERMTLREQIDLKKIAIDQTIERLRK